MRKLERNESDGSMNCQDRSKRKRNCRGSKCTHTHTHPHTHKHTEASACLSALLLCVCECVCVRERKNQKVRGKKRVGEKNEGRNKCVCQ